MLEELAGRLIEVVETCALWLGTNTGWIAALAGVVTVVEFTFHPLRWVWRAICVRSKNKTDGGDIVNSGSLHAQQSINQAGRDLTVNNYRSAEDVETITQQNRTIADLHSRLETLESVQIEARELGRSSLKHQVEKAVKDLRSAADVVGIDRDEIAEAEDALARGRTELAEHLWQRILDKRVASAASAKQEAAVAARNLGALAFLHDTEAAVNYYKQSVELDPENPDGVNQLGQLFLREGRNKEARSAFKKLLHLSETFDDESIAAVAFGNLGIADEALGETREAEGNYSRALQISRKLCDEDGIASSYGSLSGIKRKCGEFFEALDLLSKARNIYLKSGNKFGVANVDVSKAAVLTSLMRFSEAEELYQQAIQYFVSAGNKNSEAEQIANLGNLYSLWGKSPDSCRKKYYLALSIFEFLGNRTGIALANLGIGRTYGSEGRQQLAEQHVQRSLCLYRLVENPLGISDALTMLASVKLNQSDDINADKYIEEAAPILESLGHTERTAGLYVLKSEIARFRRDTERQRNMLMKAREIYRSIGSPVEGQIQRWIDELDTDS